MKIEQIRVYAEVLEQGIDFISYFSYRVAKVRVLS